MSTTVKKDHANQAKESAGQAMDKARDTASSIGDAASHAASAVGQAAQGAVGAVGQTAENATSAVGQGVQQAASTVRDYGPREGMLGSATKTVADSLESAGKYVEDKNLTGMMDDVTGLVRRNPIPAVLIGIGIGFLIGRALSATSSNRSY